MNHSLGGEHTERMTFADLAAHTGFIDEVNREPLINYVEGAVNWAYWTKRINHPLPEQGYWEVGSAALDEVLAFFRVINARAPYNPEAPVQRKRRKRKAKRDRRKYIPPEPVKPLTLKERIMAKKNAKATTEAAEAAPATTTEPQAPEVKTVKLVELAAEVGMPGQEARRHLRAARDEGKVTNAERSRWEWEEGSPELETARQILIEGKNAPKTRGRKKADAEGEATTEGQATSTDTTSVTPAGAAATEAAAAVDEPTDAELDADDEAYEE